MIFKERMSSRNYVQKPPRTPSHEYYHLPRNEHRRNPSPAAVIEALAAALPALLVPARVV